MLEGYHDKVHFNFLVVGHTKFSPDQLFGLIHALFKKYNFIVPSDLPPKVAEYGQPKKTRGDPVWTANATLVNEGDGVFRNWKDLSQPFKPIKHIKKNPIEEILFEATYVNGKRTVKVSYKLIEQQEYHEVAILKRGREFPEPGVLAEDKLPPEAGWKKLGSKRHKGLLKSLDSISGEVTDEIFQFYADLPHKTEEEEEAEAPRRRRVDRGGNPVEVPAQPAVAAPHVNSSPSLDQSPPHIEPLLHSNQLQMSVTLHLQRMTCPSHLTVPLKP